MKKLLAGLCAAALLLMCMAGVALATTVVDTITLPANQTVDVGATLQLDATITPADPTVTVRWKVSNPKFGTVAALDSDSCVITGKSPGRLFVTATAGGKSTTALVLVTAAKATSIKLNTTAKTINPSATYQLIATLSPTYNSDSVKWTSSDETVATVSDSGLVSAVSDGSETKTCVITATLTKGGKTATCKITVTKIPERYVRLTTSAVVPLHSSRPLTAVVYPTDAYNRAVVWTVVKNPQKVELKDNGDGTVLVTGKETGTATLQATAAGGHYARCVVTVKLVRYSSLSATPTSKVLEKGSTFQISIKRAPTYVSYPDLKYTSNDESVATVDEKGVVTGVGRGYARITVSGDNGRVNKYITVRVISSSEDIQVTVSAIGDVMLGGDPRKTSFNRFASLWSKYGSEYCFKKIKGQLKGVSIANLEMPLIDTSYVMQGSRGYIFRGKTVYAQALKAGGIDAVDLDNNHIMDYSTRGYTSTKSAVNKYSVGYFGLGSVFYKTVNNVKIGFAGFRPDTTSIAKVKASVKSIQSRCDIVVVSFHWGQEYRYSPSAQQIAYGRGAVDAGADLVLGHHSHVISGIELYKGRHIVYGLGTIISTVELPSDTRTFIYQHTFSVRGTTVSNDSFNIVPVRMSSDSDYNDAQPRIATGSDATAIIDKIKALSPSKNPF